MITRIEALNYRCLRYVSQPLKPYHVLVGPNASGKTTFLDVLAFLGRLVTDGVDAAVEERSRNFYDLVWGREGGRFELAVEACLPEQVRKSRDGFVSDLVRYHVVIGIDPETEALGILYERLACGDSVELARDSAEQASDPPATLARPESVTPWNKACTKYRSPSPVPVLNRPRGDFQETIVRLTQKKSIFNNLLEHEDLDFLWLAEVLGRGVHHVELNSRELRAASPPGQGVTFATDGSNLPWVVSNLQERAPGSYDDWITHLRTALPDLDDVRIVERPEDKHRYLMLRHRGGLEVPSWMLSDGTLRLLALTVLAYIPDFTAICLIEEPENSLHPLNIETAVQSLRSVYDGQVLVATHSPLLLAMTDVSDILVFSRTQEAGTKVIVGSEHPGLRDWHGEVSLGTLFAGGVLG